MQRLFLLPCLLLLLLVGLVQDECQAAGGVRPVRPGSFTNQNVYSVNQLVAQVDSNPAVAQRYAKHFGTSASEVGDYFRNNVKVDTVRVPIYTRTFYVTPSGRTRSKSIRFAKGSKVFMTTSGIPLLQVGCGNPLTKALPAMPKTKVLAETETLQAPNTPALAAIPESVIAPVEAPVAEVVALAPISEPLVTPTVGTPFAPLLGALAAVPALFGALSVNHSVTTPVPEPDFQLALSLASAAVAGATMWRTRRRCRKG